MTITSQIEQVKSLPKELPSLVFLERLTTSSGLVQHSRYGVPDLRFGYCLDDNGRALAFVSRYLTVSGKSSTRISSLATHYLSYINLCHREDGWMRNFMGYDQKFIDDIGSEDSFGRGIWGLGECLGRCQDEGLSQLARELLNISTPNISKLKSPRAAAYASLGLVAAAAEIKVDEILDQLAEKLIKMYDLHQGADWLWFENNLSYSNALLPLSLLMIGRIQENQRAKEIALQSLDWLLDQTEIEVDDGKRVPAPIGSHGWFRRGGERALYDQQPIDVGMTILALSQAYQVTKQKKYAQEMWNWFAWFYGNNLLGQIIADPKEGWAHDGLYDHGVNQNSGAESTVIYLLAALEMYCLKHNKLIF